MYAKTYTSTVSDPSGSGRVDMLTGPVAAARAVVATGAWVKSKHMNLIRGGVGAQVLFLPIRRRSKKNKNKNKNEQGCYGQNLIVRGWQHRARDVSYLAAIVPLYRGAVRQNLIVPEWRHRARDGSYLAAIVPLLYAYRIRMVEECQYYSFYKKLKNVSCEYDRVNG